MTMYTVYVKNVLKIDFEVGDWVCVCTYNALGVNVGQRRLGYGGQACLYHVTAKISSLSSYRH